MNTSRRSKRTTREDEGERTPSLPVSVKQEQEKKKKKKQIHEAKEIDHYEKKKNSQDQPRSS